MTAADASLWPHQREAVELLTKQLASVEDPAEGRRAQLRMACGLGKTRVGAAVARLIAADGRVLCWRRR
jgi:superfamily II DNA or RNA helicase